MEENQLTNTEETEKKKGKPSWRPHNGLIVKKMKKGLRYRWANRDEANLDKKQAEGWVFSNTETGGDATSQAYRDLVVMHMPEELAQARSAYYQDRTDQYLKTIQNDTDREFDKRGLERPKRRIVIE